MKKVIILLLTLLMISVVAAQSVDQEMNELVTQAEQYEMGNIDYMELQVYSSIARDKINSLLGEEMLNGHDYAVTQDAVEQYFGTPRGYTKHAWNMDKDREDFLDEGVPFFEKTLFDGKRIKLTFNAWPHISSGPTDEQLVYYWTDFQVKFKKDYGFNINQMLSEVESAAQAYMAGSKSAQDAGEIISSNQALLQEYLDDHRENCEGTMDNFFSEEFKQYKEARTRYNVEMYQGKNLNVDLSIQVPDCSTECEWAWINIWPNWEFFGPWPEDGWDKNEQYDREEFLEYEYQSLEKMLIEEFYQLEMIAGNIDNGGNSVGDIESETSKIRAIVEAMLEQKVWRNNGDMSKFDEVVQSVLSAANNFDVEKQSLTELRYENRLVVNEEVRQDAWCREVGWSQCAWDQVCSESSCVSGMGGNENCENNIDDDGDRAIDGQDPDCKNPCAGVCEDGCWSCSGEQCQSECEDGCWECDWESDQEGCNAICESSGCNQCQQDKCWSQSICTLCNECQENGGDAGDYGCYGKCETISDGMLQADACKALCDQGVEFYCAGVKQYEPCDDTTYICNGNMQPFPCTIYTCTDGDVTRKQTVSCGEEFFCGENQHVKDDICVCKAGWYDCDGDGSCESENACEGGSAEVCNDGVDNDDDYLVDCKDLSECRLQVCGEGKVCYEGSCQIEGGVGVCTEEQTLINGVCQNKCEFETECEGGQICQFGICTDLSTCSADEDCLSYNEVCENGYCEEKEQTGCVLNTDCGDEEACINNECVGVGCYLDEECSEDEACVNYNCIIVECQANEDCEDGELCSGNKCIQTIIGGCTDESCPEGQVCAGDICIDLICPEGTKKEGKECVKLFDCSTDSDCGKNEICKSGLCLEQEVKNEPLKTGEGCSVAEDCSGERDICSNGICKEIPEENFNNLVKEGFIEEEPEAIEPSFEHIEEQMMEEPVIDVTGNFFIDNWLTGAFLGVTGNYEKEIGICETNEDCGENRNCDNYDGSCHCSQGYFDCNSGEDWGDGSDSDGCESTDATCGGAREICNGGCGENQYCNVEYGWCACEEGWYDCDGVWWDCESTEQCKPCTSNSDCSEPICDSQSPSHIIEFGCFQGSTWTEEKGAVAFSGQCTFYPTGDVDTSLHFDTWGEPFDELNQYMDWGHDSWCEWELENALKERKEIEASMDEEFLEWFFEDFVNQDQNDWNTQVSAIYDSYWSIVENTRQIARASDCLGQDYPDVEPFDLEYKSPNDNGEIKIWEDYGSAKTNDFDLDLYTPYMQIWIFPPEGFIKEEFQKAMAEGRMPGEDGKKGGPSPEEQAEMRNDPQAMERIRDLVKGYDDGVLDILVKVVDDDESIFQISMQISEENLIVVEPVETYTRTADITTEVDFDFMYSLIKTGEKHMEIEHPEWAKSGMGNTVENIKTGTVMAGKISTGISTGKIKVKPISELPTMMKLMGNIMGGDDDHSDEGFEEGVKE